MHLSNLELRFYWTLLDMELHYVQFHQKKQIQLCLHTLRINFGLLGSIVFCSSMDMFNLQSASSLFLPLLTAQKRQMTIEIPVNRDYLVIASSGNKAGSEKDDPIPLICTELWRKPNNLLPSKVI